MAFRELGLTDDQLFSMPPYRTYLMQMRNIRRRERDWEQTRMLAVMIHNTTPGIKRRLREKQLIRLSFDKYNEYEPRIQDEAIAMIQKSTDIKKN